MNLSKIGKHIRLKRLFKSKRVIVSPKTMKLWRRRWINLVLFLFYSRVSIMKKNKVSLCCGEEVRKGWTNIDIVAADETVFVVDLKNIEALDSAVPENIEYCEMIHAVGYFSPYEFKGIAKVIFRKLATNGEFVLEFPCSRKIARLMFEADNNRDQGQFIEGLRGLYAFDLDNLLLQDYKHEMRYCFGWDESFASSILSEAGFLVTTLKPKSHGANNERDVRLSCRKMW